MPLYCQYKVNIAHQNVLAAVEALDLTKLLVRKVLKNKVQDNKHAMVWTPAKEKFSSAIDLMEHLFKLMARSEEGCDIESRAALLTSWKPTKIGLYLTLFEKTGVTRQPSRLSKAGK